MTPRLLLVLLAVACVGVAALPAATATGTICKPALPPKPVPGGIVGGAWDTVAATYNDINLACVPSSKQIIVAVLGVVATAEGVANSGCQTLIGEDCTAIIPPL